MMSHSIEWLVVANCCHPSMDDRTRYDRIRRRAWSILPRHWQLELEHRTSLDATTTMQILSRSDSERPNGS